MRESIKLEDLRKEVGEDMIHQLKSSQTRVRLLEKNWANDQVVKRELTAHLKASCDRCAKLRKNNRFCPNCPESDYCDNK